MARRPSASEAARVQGAQTIELVRKIAARAEAAGEILKPGEHDEPDHFERNRLIESAALTRYSGLAAIKDFRSRSIADLYEDDFETETIDHFMSELSNVMHAIVKENKHRKQELKDLYGAEMTALTFKCARIPIPANVSSFNLTPYRPLPPPSPYPPLPPYPPQYVALKAQLKARTALDPTSPEGQAAAAAGDFDPSALEGYESSAPDPLVEAREFVPGPQLSAEFARMKAELGEAREELERAKYAARRLQVRRAGGGAVPYASRAGGRGAAGGEEATQAKARARAAEDELTEVADALKKRTAQLDGIQARPPAPPQKIALKRLLQ
eukprot:tig00021070_g17912.t1